MRLAAALAALAAVTLASAAVLDGSSCGHASFCRSAAALQHRGLPV